MSALSVAAVFTLFAGVSGFCFWKFRSMRNGDSNVSGRLYSVDEFQQEIYR